MNEATERDLQSVKDYLACSRRDLCRPGLHLPLYRQSAF